MALRARTSKTETQRNIFVATSVPREIAGRTVYAPAINAVADNAPIQFQTVSPTAAYPHEADAVKAANRLVRELHHMVTTYLRRNGMEEKT